MEQTIVVSSGIIVNKVTNPAEQQNVISIEPDGENTDLTGVAPFLQLLNQQIILLTPVSESIDENKNGLLKQNQILAMVQELSEKKGTPPDNGGIGKIILFKSEDSKNNANKLSDKLLTENNFKIPDNQSIMGNATKPSAFNIADKSGLVNIDTLRALSESMAEKLKNTLKENNNISDKNSQDISSNSLSAANNGMAKVSSLDDISTSQIINRIAGEIKENVSADGGRIKITLSPPSLGTLEMDVSVRNNKVQVIIVADNKDVQLALNSHLDRLKGCLHNQGLTIDRCDVLMQNNREEYPQGFNQQTFYREGSEKNSNASKEKYSEELKPIMSIKPQIMNSPSFNPDNISIFA